MKSSDPARSVKLRATFVGIVLAVAFVGIGARAVQLQVLKGEWLSEKAASQYEMSLTSRGKRGEIFDAKLRKLAVSVDVISIGAFPAAIKDAAPTAAALAASLKMDPKKLKRQLQSSQSFVWIKRHVTPKEEASIKSLGLPGIDFITEHSRFYPYRTLAAQVIGFCGIDGNGLEGLEYFYDNDLKGKEIQVKILKDALGRGFEAESAVDNNFRGKNLVLTIDRTIQFITEKALEEAVTLHGALSGQAIVMAPDTGAVLAMANYPFFNPNTFTKYERQSWRNRSITDPFEPGSTMKIFSAAAALEYGGFTPNSIFFCENGAYRIGTNVVHDTKKHGWLSLQQIIKYSSNIGAVKIGEMVGSKSLYDGLKGFGFGSRTGIDCPGETGGSLSSYKNWAKIDAGAISFGQGVAVSALQITAATAAIANGGILMRPYTVQALTDPNGKLVKSFGPQKIRQVVSAQAAGAVGRMMVTVISEEGTGTNAALDGYTAAGKTGTAQKIEPDGTYSNDKFIASFVGFAPAENPRVVIFVAVDEPQKAHYGGTVAAPAFRKIALGALDVLNVPPKKEGGSLVADGSSEVKS